MKDSILKKDITVNTIDSLRQEIDQIHEELHSLLLRRRDLTMAIWKIKHEQGLPFFNAEREQQIVESFLKMNSEQDPALDKLLEGIMQSVLREYEKYLSGKYLS